MLSAATQLMLPRHSIPVTQNQPAEHLYVLVRGRARFFFLTLDGQKIILRWIVPGNVFGVSALLRTPSRYLVGTEMTQDSTVLRWTRGAIRSAADQFPQLLDNVLEISQEYLLWYVAAYESLTAHNAPERLAHLLIQLSNSIGVRFDYGISLDVTNEELACAANITIFTASRLLKRWAHLRIITKARNRIVIRSPRLLIESAKGQIKTANKRD